MRALVIVALVALAMARAHAEEAPSDTMTIRVHEKDTLELLAAEYYGDRDLAIFIMVANKMQHARPLKPGERLRIPVTRTVTTQKGDSFETLAGTYLGDPRRAPFLADFNSMSAEDTLATGTALTIPFAVQHTAAATESLSSIAASYFRESKQADMLKRYNFLDKTQLEKGESVAVPIFNVRVRSGKLPPIDAESKARRDQQRRASAELALALPRARTAWLQGDFQSVKEALERFGDELDFLDTSSAVEVGMLLARAHLADDDTAYAVEKFSQVLNRKPRYVVSTYWESPKVVAAWKKAGGHTEGE
ncbi:MAG: Peptidoglycan-binding lysin domain protein [Myxococcales bacterium]|nr:Peptidoglycan-binding lysin domain protein [Myxococcales bacterium]